MKTLPKRDLLVYRKMKKPYQGDVMDEYLSSLGLWRKPNANDKSCLFRAVAEQIFYTQAVYTKIRDSCISYMKRNQHVFEQFVRGDITDHLYLLEEQKIWPGNAEIQALSKLYRRDFLVYQEIGNPPLDITHNQFQEKIWLCHSGVNHYDSVYPRTYTEIAGIVQSILYEVLYEYVFKVDKAVCKAKDMMCMKSSKHDHSAANGFKDLHETQDSNAQSFDGKDHKHERKYIPFPFKVAKALCPDIYRNTEYDSWFEYKKECRESIREDVFAPGDKCQLTLPEHPGQTFNAHIQEMSPQRGPVTVFVEELGEKCKVAYSCLVPVPQPSQDQELTTRKKKVRARRELLTPALPPRLQQSVAELTRINLPSIDEHANLRPPPPQLSDCPLEVVLNKTTGSKENHCKFDNSTKWYNAQTYREENAPWRLNRGRVHFNSDDYKPPQGEFYAVEQNLSNESEDNSIQHNQPLTFKHPAEEQWIHPSRIDNPLVKGAKSAPDVNAHCPSPSTPKATAFGSNPPYTNFKTFGQIHQTIPYYSGFIIPHIENIVAPINFAAPPSADALGNDLPHCDPSTLRFFFNLGVEYYRLHSYIQHHPYPPQSCFVPLIGHSTTTNPPVYQMSKIPPHPPAALPAMLPPSPPQHEEDIVPVSGYGFPYTEMFPGHPPTQPMPPMNNQPPYLYPNPPVPSTPIPGMMMPTGGPELQPLPQGGPMVMPYHVQEPASSMIHYS